MTLIEKIKLLAKLKSTANEVEKGISMKNSTKVIVAIIGLLTSVAQMQSVQTAVANFLAAHTAVAAVVGGIAAVLLALHVPVDVSKIKSAAPLLALALVLLASGHAMAQDAPIQNLYAGGVSYSAGGSPAIAGTGLYAHAIAGTGTYAFTAIDALPNTLKPFTVSTNAGVGVAQKIATFNNIPIYIPSAVGVSWTGSNTGWQWNAGAIAAIHIKGNYYVLPSVRFLKSSVSNGTGYQPIIGVLFGWGQ